MRDYFFRRFKFGRRVALENRSPRFVRHGARDSGTDRSACARDETRFAGGGNNLHERLGPEFFCATEHLYDGVARRGLAPAADSHPNCRTGGETFADLRAAGGPACRSLITRAARFSSKSFITVRRCAARQPI